MGATLLGERVTVLEVTVGMQVVYVMTEMLEEGAGAAIGAALVGYGGGLEYLVLDVTTGQMVVPTGITEV